jgi:CRP/FNR family cyclic AMP-dependent transcriptional regulator
MRTSDERARVEQEQVVEALSQNAIFGALDEPIRRLLVDRCRHQVYRRGETVIVEGERGDKLFVILQGGVRIYRRSAAGSVVEIDRKHAGENFGELALLDESPRSASVDTTSRTVLLPIERDVFTGILEREPRAVKPLLAVLGKMIRNNIQMRSDLVFLDLQGRLARCILRLAEDAGDGRDLTRDRKVTQSELAQIVGAARQTVNGALRAFEHDNVIAVDSDGIRILDKTSLQKLAGHGETN